MLDLCAGAGGKTLAMAAAMDNKGQIFAYDSDRGRLAPIYDRLKRNGVRNVQVRAPDPGALDDLVGQDGSRRDRRAVHRLRHLAPAARREVEADARAAGSAGRRAGAILDEAVRYLKPGGTLVYITCSILPEENEQQIQQFVRTIPISRR